MLSFQASNALLAAMAGQGKTALPPDVPQQKTDLFQAFAMVLKAPLTTEEKPVTAAVQQAIQSTKVISTDVENLPDSAAATAPTDEPIFGHKLTKEEVSQSQMTTANLQLEPAFFGSETLLSRPQKLTPPDIKLDNGVAAVVELGPGPGPEQVHDARVLSEEGRTATQAPLVAPNPLNNLPHGTPPLAEKQVQVPQVATTPAPAEMPNSVFPYDSGVARPEAPSPGREPPPSAYGIALLGHSQSALAAGSEPQGEPKLPPQGGPKLPEQAEFTPGLLPVSGKLPDAKGPKFAPNAEDALESRNAAAPVKDTTAVQGPKDAEQTILPFSGAFPVGDAIEMPIASGVQAETAHIGAGPAFSPTLIDPRPGISVPGPAPVRSPAASTSENDAIAAGSTLKVAPDASPEVEALPVPQVATSRSQAAIPVPPIFAPVTTSAKSWAKADGPVQTPIAASGMPKDVGTSPQEPAPRPGTAQTTDDAPADALRLAPAGGVLPPIGADPQLGGPVETLKVDLSAPSNVSHRQDPGFVRPETATAISRQLVEIATQAMDKPVELALNPEELGRVSMRVTSGDGGVSVAIVAERPETLELMRRHIDQLARDFREMGFLDASFSFGQQNKGQRPGAALSAGAHEDGAIAAESRAEIALNLTPQNSGLDLRL